MARRATDTVVVGLVQEGKTTFPEERRTGVMESPDRRTWTGPGGVARGSGVGSAGATGQCGVRDGSLQPILSRVSSGTGQTLRYGECRSGKPFIGTACSSCPLTIRSAVVRVGRCHIHLHRKGTVNTFPCSQTQVFFWRA